MALSKQQREDLKIALELKLTSLKRAQKSATAEFETVFTDAIARYTALSLEVSKL